MCENFTSYIAGCNHLRVLLKDVSISVLVHTFLQPADDSVMISLVRNVIALIVSKQRIMDAASSSTLYLILATYVCSYH